MTIRLQLTLYWAGVLSLMMAAAGLAVFLLFQRQQWGRIDSALMEEADTATETIARLGPGIANQIIAKLSEERDIGPSRRIWLAVRGNNATAAPRGGWATERVIADWGDRRADLPVLSERRFERPIVDGRADVFRYAIVPFRFAGADAYLADGVDTRAVRESIKRLRTSLLLTLPVLLLLSVSVGYWLAGRTLSPLVTVAGALAEISPLDLTGRVACPAVEDELARLVRAINSLLERLARAAEAERRFAADAAHELRTPLAVLRSGIEVALRRERSTSEYAQALTSALGEVVKLCGMADELLTLSRVDQEFRSGRERIDVSALAHEVVDTIEPLAASKQLRVEAHIADGIMVNGNGDHLRRVLINLLDNALKFTAQGCVTVGLESCDGKAELRVTDTGPGIAPAELPFIFDRFFRGRAGHAPGNGLGLSLCREIVQLHGGKISAANRAGGGAEFAVVLPESPAA